MLTHLTIRNLAITESIDIEFRKGMSAITGETGAGKSILIDSLGYALGNRADSNLVRAGSDRAEISAEFDITHISSAKNWLVDQELINGNECILRRTISKEGRSRAFINGQTVPVQQLKQLGNLLIDLHSQHEHHSLMQPDTQRKLLDEFAGHIPLVNQVTETYQTWRKLNKVVSNAKAQQEDKEAKIQLLSYQLEELDNLDLQPGEIEALETEQKLLSQGEEIIKTLGQVGDICQSDDAGVVEQIRFCVQSINKLQNPATENLGQQMLDIQIQLEECLSDIGAFTDRFELDDARLAEVNDRLSLIYNLARKHQIIPDEIIHFHQSIQNELSEAKAFEQSFEEDLEKLNDTQLQYQNICKQLTTRRNQAASHFSKLVTEQMQQLSLTGANLDVKVQPLQSDRFAAFGSEDIEFHIQTNPGQPAGPLSKVASGGELSRISLAIQVICAENSQIPTLVFDEVDVGISGGTSELVGRMLRLLGNQGQVLCVTHQPQVSSLAHHHLKVSKHITKDQTRTQMDWLNENDRTQELARLLGGIEITGQTLAHAEEMLNLGQIEH